MTQRQTTPWKPGDIYEWTYVKPERPYQRVILPGKSFNLGAPSDALDSCEDRYIRTMLLKPQRWVDEYAQTRWAWVVADV